MCFSVIIDMKPEIEISAGEIALRSSGETLKTTPLGSCMAIAGYSTETSTGILAHIMLPGEAPANYPLKNRYSANAIRAIIGRIRNRGLDPAVFQYTASGAANVMGKTDDTLTKSVAAEVLSGMQKNDMRIIRKSVGGFKRRVIKLNLAGGIVYQSIGDTPFSVFCVFKPETPYNDS